MDTLAAVMQAVLLYGSLLNVLSIKMASLNAKVLNLRITTTRYLAESPV
jgi:hypothetical protein